MKKLISIVSIMVLCIFLLSACASGASITGNNNNSSNINSSGNVSNKELTINFSFGERIGTYSGEFVNNLPNGQGTFKTKNTENQGWTYEGEWVNGHFQGEGKTTWNDGTMEIGTYYKDVIVPLKGEAIKTLYSSPGSFKNHVVEIIGKVFTSPEVSDEGTVIQMYTDFENDDNNTIVHINDENFKVKTDDYVKIVGKVGDVFEGENAFGASITAPTINAITQEIISYKDATAPTIKKINLNKTIKQHGYSVTLKKVEFAKTETRIYVKVINAGKSKFSLYSFNAKLVQDGKQYEEQQNYDADYPEIQSDLLMGITTEGVIVFPHIKDSSFKVLLDGSSDDYEEEFTLYTFYIKN